MNPYLEAKGKNLSEAFANAAYQFFDLITDASSIEAKESIPIFCESADLDLLFSDWVNSLIWEIRDKKMLFSRFEIQVEGINVKGKIWGEKINPQKHALKRSQIQGIAFDRLHCLEDQQGVRVGGVLNDFERHGLNLKTLWFD